MKNKNSSRDEVNVASAVPDWALLKWYSDDVKHTAHAGLLHGVTSECVAQQFGARSNKQKFFLPNMTLCCLESNLLESRVSTHPPQSENPIMVHKASIN